VTEEHEELEQSIVQRKEKLFSSDEPHMLEMLNSEKLVGLKFVQRHLYKNGAIYSGYMG
jgi:hypothetical protein